MAARRNMNTRKLALVMYPELTREQIEYVAHTVKEFLSQL